MVSAASASRSDFAAAHAFSSDLGAATVDFAIVGSVTPAATAAMKHVFANFIIVLLLLFVFDLYMIAPKANLPFPR